jgi:Domain of unknown function (DUF4410)
MKSQRMHTISGHCHANQASQPRQVVLSILTALLLVPFCTAQSGDPNAQKPSPSQSDRKKIIYVRDFDLDTKNFKQDKGGITGKGYLLPASPMSLFGRKHEDPEKAATKMNLLITNSVVSELQKRGFNAQRLLWFEDPATEGLLVEGAITQLNEGNQMQRALLGFGAGRAKIELYVTVTDLSASGQQLYDSSMQKSSSRRPGGAIALNPYAGAAGFVAKFAMTKNAPEKMVKKTASQIAAELIKHINSDSLLAAGQQLPTQ